MAKTEDIEAKLAAYVDGELDAAGRAQIEKHLTEHPQHRQLIADLMQQRTLLQSMPRQSAPPEVAEAFNAQLERAVLLGDVDAGADEPGFRIGYFAHFRAVAAMLVLTGGLGILIWSILPHGTKQPQLAEITLSPATQSADDFHGVTLARTEDFDKELARIRAADEAERRATTTPNTDVEASRDAFAAGGGGGFGGGGQRGGGGGGRGGGGVGAGALASATPDMNFVAPGTAQPIFSNGGVLAERRMVGEILADQLKLGPPSPPTPPFLYVFSTDNTNIACEQVTSYLTSNGITWENQSEPMPAPLDLGVSQTGMASRMSTQNVAVKSPAGAADQNAQQQSNNSSPSSNRIIARQVPRSAVEVAAGLDQLKTQNKVEPLSLARNASAAPLVQRKDVADSQQQSSQRELTPPAMALSSAPTSQPFTGTNFAPTLEPADSKFSEVAIAKPSTQPEYKQKSLDDASKIELANPATQPSQDLVDMVILVQQNDPVADVPATQPATAPAP